MVFEEQVAYYLDKYLGKFVKGLSKDALKISVWAGNVELTNMQLKSEALNALKLPIKVKAGFLGSVKLKIPWNRLGQEPVVVYLDRIFLLAEPATNVDGGDSGDAVQEAKMKRVTEAERKLVEAQGEASMKQEVNNSSWLGSLISTIIGNLKLSISNIHVRYEDLESNPGHPFSAGLTLEKLAAVTVDEDGKETFVTGGSLDRIQKLADLQRLAIYFDPDCEPWKIDKKWEDLRPNEWTEIFVPGIKAGDSKAVKLTHSYVLQPVGGNARYYKLANKDHRDPDSPAQKAIVTLDDVTVGMAEGQYRDVLKLVENFSTFNKRLHYAHYRPSVPIKEDKRAWWQYAYKSVAEQQKRASGHVSWSRVVRLSALRKKYMSLYVSSLQSGNPDRISVDDNKEIKTMDRELDTDVIIQWRMMAHSFVDSTRAKDEKKKQQQNKGWWPFGWGGDSTEPAPEAKFTDEDLEKFNQLIGYQEGQQSNILPGQEPANMLHTLLDVRMRHNATKLVSQDKEDLLEVSSEDLQCVLHMYPKTMRFNLRLGSYEVSCPEGLLVESATKTESVNATFTYLPSEMDLDSSGEKLDWSLAAKASPCYAKVLMKSINKVMKFFQSSKAVSRSVALDTATALQTTLDEVTKNAQQQINQALKDRPRFSIDLDLAAPKITIPTDFYPDGEHQCNLLVDLGYFSLQTELDEKPTESKKENELYMRFRMRLTDVSAILVDGDHDWKKAYEDVEGYLVERKKEQKRDTYLPVLDKCGMLVAIQQICVPHPQYPTTRVALRVPSLGFHVSPARYHRLMQVLKVFQSSETDDDNAVHPWEPSDFEGGASVLAWKGVGHREAVWQRRHVVLTGPFLYLLESPTAQTYKYCSSLIGKQISVVPPESVGDIPYVLAVCDAGQFNSKVAESVNALLLRFEDESVMNSWQGRITGAIYRTSAPAAIASLVNNKSEEDDPKAAVVAASEGSALDSSEQEKLFMIGVLDELKIIISNSQIEDFASKQILLEQEKPLLEFRAIGIKVEFAMKTYDMSVGAVLQALELEDKCHGHVSPSCKYLARSYIKTSKTPQTPRANGKGKQSGRHRNQRPSSFHHSKRISRDGPNSGSDRFFDATEDLDSEDSSSGHQLRRSSHSLSNFFDAEEGAMEEPPTFERTTGLLPIINPSSKDHDVVQHEELKNFVKVQVIMCSQDSPDYANVDKQVTVALATLSFFSNRRTLLALLDLVTAITADVEPQDPNPAPSSTEADAIVSSINPKAMDDKGQGDESNASFHRNDSVVKGLLGRGKSRIVFLVVLDMDRAQIVLNLEDGNQLSVLTLADLHTEVKVFPASFGIKAALGNLQVTDGSLDDKHPYHYICNMRDPDGASFIALEFLSFNKEDGDYEGFDYSVMGKLSEVRIVFLNRFTQEIVNYFMGMIPKNSKEYVVKLKDRVTDVENFFDQSEIEGQPAMKLGLSLNKPVIIMPRSTTSMDFLELDILHINLFNNHQWLGGDKDELKAVHLETTTLELEDLHLVVGVDGQTGEGIIQEARGLALVLRRPIRDLWHQLPAAEASINIDELRAALSDKEYQVITECAISNMAEAPNLPPSVNEGGPDDKHEDQPEVETIVHEPESSSSPPENGQNDSSREDAWTTIKVGVGINMVELGLFTGQSRESPLAAIQVTGVWASYKANTLQESNIQATLEKFSVRDDREGTEAEMRYMIGNADDGDSNPIEKKSQEVKAMEKHGKGMQKHGSCRKPDCRSALTMLVMDAKIAPSLQVVSLRIQRPRLLVALDFLLAVAEFFIPSIHSMLSDGKGNENPLDIQNAIFFKDKVYTQSSDEIVLSPKTPLVADMDGIDTYEYDGRAASIRLMDRKGADLRDFSKEVVIFVGDGKKLIFKNVVILNGDFLDSCISLGNNSSYSALKEDGVYLEGQPEKHNESVSQNQTESVVDGQDENPSNDQAQNKPATELIFDLQAVSPELTFYDSMTRVGETVLVPEKLLRMRMNVFARFVMKGEDMELNAQVNGLSVAASSGIQVMEPADMVVKYTKANGKQNLNLVSTEIYTNFSFSIIQLILRLQVDVMSFLRITSEQITEECSEFDKVWSDNLAVGANCITFWRPRAPPGFAVLGDCMTPRDELPSKGVVAVNMSMARTKRPLELVLLWSSDEVHSPTEGPSDDDDDSNVCCVWLPVPPPGYVALGCVASTGRRPPLLNTCFCVLGHLVTSCGTKDCIIITGPESQEEPEKKKWPFWRVDNSTGSFFLESATEHAQNYRPRELRNVLSNYESFPVQETKPQTVRPSTVKHQSPLQGDPSGMIPVSGLSSGRFYENVARFDLVWWDKNSGSRTGVSIWRPVVPSGCVILGDVAVKGYEPPSTGLVLHDAVDRGLLKPERFLERGQLPRKRGMGAVTFWLPLAPPGYVALGCIASVGSSPDPDNLIRCVRSDLVIGSNFSNSNLWDTSDMKHRVDELSIWPVENQAFSFITQRGLKHPPKRLALAIADMKKNNAPKNLVIEAEVKQISATAFDDFGGLMAPLVDISLSAITVSLHGRPEAFSSTVNFSLAAATFNGKYNAWEPLLESWDGRVRFEYNSDPSDPSRPTESRFRLTASSPVNFNVSTANLNMFLEAYASWNRLNRMEQNSKKQFSIDSRGRVNNKPAINAKGQRTMHCVNHNKLGEELFLRILVDNEPKILLLPSPGTVTVKLPTAQRMQDSGTKATRRKNPTKIVALRIGDAEVPKDEGIGGREYMVAVRIVPRTQTSNQRQLQYQSARTRCVPPEDGLSSETVVIHWDEVFIFEVEPQEGNSAEIIVTDLGKGTNVGCCFLELLEDSHNSSKLTSEMTVGGHIPWNLLVLEWESLHPSEISEDKADDTTQPCGKVSLAKHFFSLVGDPLKQRDGTGHERGTIQVGPSREGPWNPVGLNYALGPAPWTLNDDVIATEFYVENGVKHLVMRSLVSVQNGTDFDLEVSLAMVSRLRKSTAVQESGESEEIGETIEEDFFENERYQPIVGWGSKWPGHLLPTDPARYTSRDYTNPSKESPDVKLPMGWEWKTNWHVENVPEGDQDGWGYGFDFRTLQWPPKSHSEKVHSFVRRRRWLRVRQSIAKGGSRVSLGVVKPGDDLPLPLACLRQTSANYCLQIRPTSTSHGLPYEWSQVIPFKGLREGKKQPPLKEIRVRSLTETEELLSCAVQSSSSTTQNKDLWFCLEASSSEIGKDAELDPIKEWKITITASIMLKNFLPIPCEYSVSEKSVHSRLVVRDRGVIKPGHSVGIFHIDLRKGIYLTWLPQGGWNPKKETVLISHPYREPADHITYTNSRSSRSLRVMIDHDREEKGVAGKVLVFYVPCWLDSEKCPPLQYRIVEILQRGDTKLASNTDEYGDTGKALDDVKVGGVKVGNVIEQVNFEEKDEYPTMLSEMDLKTTGLSVAINRGNNEIQFGSVSALSLLENQDEYLELRGLAESGLVFRFLVSINSCPLDFAKTKVIRIRPFMLFTNRVGEALHLKQKTTKDFRTLQPSDWRVSFPFMAGEELQLLQIKLEGYEWSCPFAVEKETSITIPLQKSNGFRRFIKVDIRGYEDGSKFSVRFRPGSTRGPYRLENRTPDARLKFRQVGLGDDSWQTLKPHTTKTFAWDDPEGARELEVLPANADASNIIKYEIDKIGDDHAELSYGSELAQNISVRVIELIEIKTIRFYCKVVELEDIDEDEEIESSGPLEGGQDLAQVDEQPGPAARAKVEFVVNIGKLGVSITDQHPREILYLSLDNIMTSYDVGFGERITRLKVRIGYLQLDNQLPLSWMPVLLAPEKRDESKEFLIKMSLHTYDDKAETRQVYPYVGLQVESGFRINIHEPIIWALVNMLNNLHLDRLSEDSTVVGVDPEIKIDLIDLSEVRLKLTLDTAANTRPRGMLGVWSPFVTTLGNTNKMPIRLGSVLHHNRYMRKSAVSGAIVTRIRRDLIHQPLQLLSGVNVLGMTSSTLGTLSQGAAELSKDGKYLRLRSAKDRNRNVGGVGDGLLQGTEALARGFGYGISGVVTKPITNARQHGFVGFFQGVGKAALGFVMLPVSGVLDFVSLTVNGVGVTCISCFELFEHEPTFTRRRLPRAIKGSNIILPYIPHESEGQAILQLAESKSFYGFKGAFTDAAKFAWSDFYEAHFELPKSKVLVLTNRRILMLARPKSHFQQPEKTYEDPSNILWEITWRNLLAVESHQSAAHGPCLLLHLRRSSSSFARTVKCQFGNAEAGTSHLQQVSNTLHRLWKEYGPDRKTVASEANRRKKYQPGRLSSTPRLKEAENLKNVGYQERRTKSSNSGNGMPSRSGSFTKDVMLFDQIWNSEQESSGSCCIPSFSGELCTIWRPNAPEGYISVGDIARIGSDPPPVAIIYRMDDDYFAPPLSYNLVWRNWKDGFCIPVSIWMPKAPDGYVAVGCVAVPGYIEPDMKAAWCVREDLTEVTTLEENEIWHAPNKSPWSCFIYSVASESLSFIATREQKQDSSRRYRKVKLDS